MRTYQQITRNALIKDHCEHQSDNPQCNSYAARYFLLTQALISFLSQSCLFSHDCDVTGSLG